MRGIGVLAALGVLLSACAGPSTASPGGSLATASTAQIASPSASESGSNLPSGWIVFSPPDGSFSVGMPAEPQASTQTQNTEVGTVEIHLFGYETASVAYIVSYNDYPAGSLDGQDPQALLDGAVQGALQSANATMRSATSITLGTAPGRDLVAAVQGGTLHSRIYVVGVRLYQVLVAGEGTDLPDVDAYLDSFLILRP